MNSVFLKQRFRTNRVIIILTYFTLCFYSTLSLTTTPVSNLDSTPKTLNKSSLEKEIMINWSRQLGVTCIHCHNLENFKDDTKINFKIALKHNQMVRVLQEEVFSERDKGNSLKVKVDCYMCHRGKEVPEYIEPPLHLTK